MRPALAFLFLAFAVSPSAFPAPAAQPVVQTYDELLHAIREVRSSSQVRIEAAVEAEKVREAWETGKLIDEHILLHKERAEYGKQVLDRLAKDLGTSQTELSFMLQFARAYPIHWPANKLSWSHYQALLSLNDPKERDEVTKEALEKSWNRDQVREEVRRRQARAGVRSEEPEPLTVSRPGKTYTYRVVKAVVGPLTGQLVLDLGFSNYFQPEKITQFKEGEIVTWERGNLKRISGEPGELFTYTIYVTQVIDGDTLRAVVDLGFKFSTVQTLRLRGLDAPEIESTDGREAKAFLEKQLTQNGAPVLIKTVKSDKYDRYLADVWVGETYVNQKLIDKGLAVKVSE